MSRDGIELALLEPLSERLASDYLEHHGVLPLRLLDGSVLVGTWHDEIPAEVIDDLQLLFEREIEPVSLPEPELRQTIRRVYGAVGVTAESVIAGLGSSVSTVSLQEGALDDLVSLANEAPVVKLVNLLLLEALEARASDVHLEAYAETLRVRYRIDGVLQDAPSPPANLLAAVVSRLKIMAELDVAERRVPQDGRIRLRLQDRQVDVRVSTLPTLHGESIVLRLLDKEKGWGRLDELGMAGDTLSEFQRAIAQPHGIVLVTGPTGSGKTTTLYAAVEHIRTGREKILTVEDPVEYELAGVPQVPVNEKVGVSFAAALRALLRQDPDVLLVGEIRDHETAEIATHAALTGHLVLSTLHTNDATSALTRLTDLGVASYLVASTVEVILAQRLVRVVCEQCAEWVKPDERWHTAFGRAGLTRIRRGRGCADCRGTGYRGRTGLYELLVMSDALREGVLQAKSAANLRSIAGEQGMRGLSDDGLRLVAEGVTTPEELVRMARI